MRQHGLGIIASTISLTICFVVPAAASGRDDLVIADFEGEDYGAWTVEGTAFGRRPARGTLPGQMNVEGFVGRGLVNSFHGGDDATGKLISPEFTIERKAINFLVGGGRYPGETCVNLKVGGATVRTATGPNYQPGGSEQLDWSSWNVEELAGKRATIEIVDTRRGGWGHINVDQIVQSDRPMTFGPARRELVAERRYLHLPVRNGARKLRMKLASGSRTLDEFEIELADGRTDFVTFFDVGAVRGDPLSISVDRLAIGSDALAAITQSDELPDQGTMYQERGRPQFHFSSRRGWLNDPNGLVYHEGMWHLFYQHNPFGWNWGNMHWGHATSHDLFHWQEQPEALVPRAFGDWCFSGSTVVDAQNTSGFKRGTRDVLVAAYTSTGRGEAIAYSNDGGETWTEYEANPVVKHQGRDPKLLWHEPSKRWIMAVYDEADGKRQIAFYTSVDLKHWEFASRIDGFFECPDLFELMGEARRAWVLYGADGKYLLGDFDGREFHPQTAKLQLWHGRFYAAQTYSDAPRGRRVQIGWGQGIEFPGMPFNQQMVVPVELTLRDTSDGPRMFAEPVAELAQLEGPSREWRDVPLASLESPLAEVRGELLRATVEIAGGTAVRAGLSAGGLEVVYDRQAQRLTCGNVEAPLAPQADGSIRLEILVDRGSVEVFGNQGRVALSARRESPGSKPLRPIVAGGESPRVRLRVAELRSAWPYATQARRRGG